MTPDELYASATSGDYKVSHHAFEKLLALRRHPDTRMLPSLERILSHFNESDSILKHAAMHAISSPEAPEAHQRLLEFVSSGQVDFGSAHTYAFAWGDWEGRDRFIGDYLLKSLSPGL